MTDLHVDLARITDGEKSILFRFLGFRDYFSVDWFAEYKDILPSELISTIIFLEQRQWIIPVKDKKGFYEWTSHFPRSDMSRHVTEEDMSRYYREAVDILIRHLPEDDENILKIAHHCLLAGLKGRDLNLIFRAAYHEEKNHKISSAIKLYDRLLEFIEDLIISDKIDLSLDQCQLFTKTIERRASLSLFNPNIKKTNRLLCMALDTAILIDDIPSQASLQLLIGQNYWMSFQFEKAVYHFDLGWKMINTAKIDSAETRRRGLQLQGMSYWIKGELPKAIEAYENSLGELDSIAADDFSLMTALNLALCYVQVGMPQRGLGISETIYNQTAKNENWPIASFALGTSGAILLEMNEIKTSRTYFEMALELSSREGIPMAEIYAGMGLADIECLAGNFEKAAEYFKVRWRIRKSSWYHILNIAHSFEAYFRLSRQGFTFQELNQLNDYFYQVTKEKVHRYMYGILKRLQLELMDNEKTHRTKIKEFKLLEHSVEESGALFETAKIRIDLARLSLQTNNWEMAENYAGKAWEFLRHIAKNAFPSDLLHLIPHDEGAHDHRLFDLIVETGEAITNQNNLEHLLTNIIVAMSKYTRAERSALFIKDKKSHDLKMIASRNLLPEHIEDESFKDVMDIIANAVSRNESHVILREIHNEDPFTLRRIIITLLMLGRQVMGCLYLDSRFFPRKLGADRTSLLSALAAQIAVSIDRAQAYDEIAHLNERLIQENRYYKEEKEEFRPFGEIIGSSEAIINIQHLIHKVAPTQSTVLICGETGVGKELVARAIHRQSARRNGPFIRVNCAALPDTLIDSELFGHEKGAFTGAIKTKAGRFELAHHGSIFLDEVSELPLSTQSRLLRILQEKEFQRVGGTKTLHSDFRLITATNKDLKEEVERGAFRSDLFYRLNVFPITVPPLRQRRSDIPLLAEHFLNLFSSQYNRAYPGIPESEMEKLKSYSWPGNIRELANMVEHALIIAGPRIRFPEFASPRHIEQDEDEVFDLREMEKMQIIKALKKAHGKIGGAHSASELLGLKRTTLINRMKKLGITVEKSYSEIQ